ncbi:MAG TPA: valine--tRNA ligase [Candidatus Limnocylindria bacterium]|nr:valine--tRNA ligase [Candidatus Limnocylindria bacterium]
MTAQLKAPEAVLRYSGKSFDPSAVETFLYDWWESSGFFTPGPATPGETPFVMMLPLPNVTGDLHLGHALGFGGYEDLMARWHRMRGEPTLWLPGSDHAGIIAQIVVEKELAKEGAGRTNASDSPTLGLTRDEFLGEMWRWMDHYKPRIYKQLRMLGCSLDWTRVHFTMDPDMQRRVRIHFIRLYRKGHLYRADRIVHWCLTCQTTYSDLEALHIVRTDELSYVRYRWAEAMPAGTPDVVVATTRPETIVADTAVAVHPEDDRWKGFIGREVLVPVSERKVKIVGDAAVDRAFGTGALKVTPGHDATDFEIGQRHGLQVLSAIDPRGFMTPAAGPLAGLDRDAARIAMLEKLKEQGLLVRQEPITHNVGIHDRCGTVDEPLVMKQWWMKMAPLAKPAIEAVRDGTVRIIPKYQEKIYFEWMENIRDWPVSRQIWWGHAIPVWYCTDCDEIVVPAEDAPDPTTCPKCRSTELRHDPDVLDTWFSSALWPHSTLGWPEETSDLARFYPGSVLETGWDILFFWVARMLMMGLENMGDVPFRTVYLHGLVRAGRQKMGKSKGNAVSPVEMIQSHGADALRYALVSGVSAGADSEFSEGKLENGRRFVNKLWNVGRFALTQLEARPAALSGPIDVAPAGAALTEADRWILSRTEAAIEELTRLIEQYQFGEYATALQQFVWTELADFYIELAKPQRRPAGSEDAAVRTLAYVLDRVLRLAHPSIPFVTETLALQLWAHGHRSDPAPSLVTSRWPEAGARDAVLEERFGLAIEVIRRIRERRQEAGVDPRATVQVALGGDAAALEPFAEIIASLTSALVRFGGGEGVPTLVRAVEVRVDVPREAAADRARLEKELAEALTLLDHSETLLRSDFAKRAPAPVVAKARATLAEREAAVASLRAELAKLGT